MVSLLLSLASLLALSAVVWAECNQPFGVRASKVPSSVAKSQVSNGLGNEVFAEVGLHQVSGCCLNGADGCYIRCVAASYKNVYHNLVDSDKDEIYISTKDLAAMTKLCEASCNHNDGTKDAYFTFRSTADVIPDVSSSRLQSPLLRSSASLISGFKPLDGSVSSNSYY